MKEPSGHQVTQLLKAWSEGEATALEKIMPLVYQELHRMARRYMAHEKPGHTLQATALVHEAYVRLADSTQASFENRAQFFALCAQVMRHILVDHARAQEAEKRGGNQPKVTLDEALVFSAEKSAEVLALDHALTRLAARDPRQARVVELRFFGGLSEEEAGKVLGISTRTVKREWSMARAWLYNEINKPPTTQAGADPH